MWLEAAVIVKHRANIVDLCEDSLTSSLTAGFRAQRYVSAFLAISEAMVVPQLPAPSTLTRVAEDACLLVKLPPRHSA